MNNYRLFDELLAMWLRIWPRGSHIPDSMMLASTIAYWGTARTNEHGAITDQERKTTRGSLTLPHEIRGIWAQSQHRPCTLAHSALASSLAHKAAHIMQQILPEHYHRQEWRFLKTCRSATTCHKAPSASARCVNE